jgi:hypothetical protein
LEISKNNSMLLDFLSTTMAIWLILFFVWLAVLIVTMIKLINRTDMLLLEKVLWGFLIFIAPFFGLLIYLIYGAKRRSQKRIRR